MTPPKKKPHGLTKLDKLGIKENVLRLTRNIFENPQQRLHLVKD